MASCAYDSLAQLKQETAVTWQYDVSQEAAPQVNVWAQDWLEDAFMHPIMVSSNQLRFEENLRGPGWTVGVGRGVSLLEAVASLSLQSDMCAAPACKVSLLLWICSWAEDQGEADKVLITPKLTAAMLALHLFSEQIK